MVCILSGFSGPVGGHVIALNLTVIRALIAVSLRGCPSQDTCRNPQTRLTSASLLLAVSTTSSSGVILVSLVPLAFIGSDKSLSLIEIAYPSMFSDLRSYHYEAFSTPTGPPYRDP
ncbi:unnamed protein product [Somion occarium]|uniref:Uncharacterized protein n=1 Tax=Somion occarium TaxID=3059160 RepID=A0ABP1CUG0_9APHY